MCRVVGERDFKFFYFIFTVFNNNQHQNIFIYFFYFLYHVNNFLIIIQIKNSLQIFLYKHFLLYIIFIIFYNFKINNPLLYVCLSFIKQGLS
jgi:hypothetical protein